MKRKPHTLMPLELAILQAGLDLARQGTDAFYGYLIAAAVRDLEGARLLRGYGTIYKALDRLESGGLLRSYWEDAQVAAEAQRPRRRLYQVTPEGARALAAGQVAAPATIALRPALL